MLSLIVIIIGIVVLYFANLMYSSEEIKISEIDKKFVGNYVKITGKVVYESYKKGNIFLKVSDGSKTIPVFIYRNVASQLTNKNLKYLTVSVYGLVQEYKGMIEIVPKKSSDVRVIE